MRSNIATILLSCLCFMAPAFFDGYPLMYPDSGTYIISGQELSIPVDRPIFYGIFIRFSSLNYSLWFTIFFQSLLCAIILRLFLKLLLPAHSRNTALLLLSVIIAGLTGMAWYASQIMPDIFTPLALLCFGMLLFPGYYRRHERFFIFLVLTISLLVHFSNLALVIALLVLLAALKLLGAERGLFRWKHLATGTTALAISVLLAMGSSYALDGKWQLSKGSHAFVMGHLVDSGILHNYLQSNCGEQNFKLCQYRDDLPTSSRELHWDANSPMHQEGGWLAVKEDYNQIIGDILLDADYTLPLLLEMVRATFSQLMQIGVGSTLGGEFYASPASPPYGAVSTYFPHELTLYLQSRQTTNLWGQNLNFEWINKLNGLVMLASAAMLVTLFPNNRLRARLLPNRTARWLLALILLGIFLNAAITANLSVVNDRLQNRIDWLLPCFILILLLRTKAMEKWLPPSIEAKHKQNP